MSSNILITGGSGRLGQECKNIFYSAFAPSSRELNILSEPALTEYILKYNIKRIIHLAAMTDVRLCEQDKAKAYETNVLGTKNVVQASLKSKIDYFLYVSTACVFPGNGEIDSYAEDDFPFPKNYYGLTKLLAEQIIECGLKNQVKYNIIRTNFTSMPWEYEKAFTDRFGTYLFARDVAKGISDIFKAQPDDSIIHICGNKKMSMYEYAILGGSRVEKMSLSDYSGPPLTINMCLKTKNWHPYDIGKE
jgi:dTDP-4-dehydrorhamnose reductase